MWNLIIGITLLINKDYVEKSELNIYIYIEREREIDIGGWVQVTPNVILSNVTSSNNLLLHLYLVYVKVNTYYLSFDT